MTALAGKYFACTAVYLAFLTVNASAMNCQRFAKEAQSAIKTHVAALQGYDSGLSVDILALKAADQTVGGYCIAASHGGFTYHYTGPGGTFPTSAVAPNGDCP